MLCNAHDWNLHPNTHPQRHFRGTVSFEGGKWILIKSGGWLDGPYWSGGMRADVARDSRRMWRGGVRVGCLKNCTNHCGERLQRHTRASLFNQQRKVISNSIIFFAGGNSKQMATIAMGLIAISRHRERLFLQDKFTVASWGFHQRGDACQQVNGIRDATDVQRAFQSIPSDSIISQCSHSFCLFVWLAG